MIAAVIDVKVDQSRFDELKDVFTALQKTVLENEPGAMVYHLLKPRDGSPNCRFIEIYQDMASVEIHAAASYMQDARPKLMACFTEPPMVEIYEVVV